MRKRGFTQSSCLHCRSVLSTSHMSFRLIVWFIFPLVTSIAFTLSSCSSPNFLTSNIRHLLSLILPPLHFILTPTLSLSLSLFLTLTVYLIVLHCLRECDPDLCKACGVSVHPMLVQHLMKLVPNFRMCCNSSIRRHKGKKTRVGRSTINGWGTFMLEDVQKSEFIIEYTGGKWMKSFSDKNSLIQKFKLRVNSLKHATRINSIWWPFTLVSGVFFSLMLPYIWIHDFWKKKCNTSPHTHRTGEVISLEEAERRGKIYDKQSSTFLFELNRGNTNAIFCISGLTASACILVSFC